jgi:hypothetical protein
VAESHGREGRERGEQEGRARATVAVVNTAIEARPSAPLDCSANDAMATLDGATCLRV